VIVRPISIRWISDVPSKIVKILAVEAESPAYLATGLNCANTDTQGFRSSPARGVPPPILVPRTGSRPQGRRARYACWRCFPDRRHPGFMTMSPEHVDLHRMVDRLDPDQVRALRAVAQQLLRPSVRHPDSGETLARSGNRCWPTNQCGTSPSSAYSTVHRIAPSAPRRSCARSSQSADADR
jgi:hypothetical protein